MKILYVGSNMFGLYAFRKAAESLGAEFTDFVKERYNDSFDGNFELLRISEDILSENVDAYVVDLDLFIDDEQVLVSEIYKIKESMNSKVIVHAPLYDDEAKILLDLRALGITDIITAAENQGELIEKFIAALNTAPSDYEVKEQEYIMKDREKTVEDVLKELPQLKEIKEPVPKVLQLGLAKKAARVLKIAVIGCKTGIGTTTAAIQLVKYLNSLEEATAAYIEMNNTGYVDKLQDHFDCETHPQELSGCKLGGVPMFSDPKKLTSVLAEGYKVCVYDYGVFEKQPSIYDKDIIILIGGIKANEIVETTACIDELIRLDNVFYVMNFVPERSYGTVKDFMGDYGKSTYFFTQAYDPFVLAVKNGEIFADILSKTEEPTETFKNKKLRRIFG